VWPSKEQKVYQVNTENTLMSVKNLSAAGGVLEFGYGVSPKCFYVPDSGKGSLIYSVNHKVNASALSGSSSCVTVLRVEELR
jgi:hypothetical protein